MPLRKKKELGKDKEKGKKDTWTKNSKAKALLRQDIISGAVPSDMPAKDVYEMHPECKE